MAIETRRIPFPAAVVCPKQPWTTWWWPASTICGSVENRFKQYPGQIAAIILEPILMNVGLCIPQPGFLEGLRETLRRQNGALLIFDEVKTGAKLAWGGASDYFGVKPDMICLAKSIGGGLPLGAFGASRKVMGLDLRSQGLPRRHVQHEPRGDGGGPGDVSAKC